MKEIFELARHVPSPVASRDLSNFGIVMSLFLGGEPAVTIAEAYRDEFKNRIDAGNDGRSGGKFRLLWIQNRIQFKHGLEKMLEEEYGASIIIDELNDITWDPIDPENPFEGFARRSISIPFNGTIETRIDHLKKLAREYRIDGAVNPVQLGMPPGHRRERAHRKRTQGDRRSGAEPRGGLRRFAQVHGGTGPHEAGGVHGDAGVPTAALAVTQKGQRCIISVFVMDCGVSVPRNPDTIGALSATRITNEKISSKWQTAVV